MTKSEMQIENHDAFIKTESEIIMTKHTHADLGQILVSKEEIQATCQQLGRQITEDYGGKEVLVVCVLKGASRFHVGSDT